MRFESVAFGGFMRMSVVAFGVPLSTGNVVTTEFASGPAVLSDITSVDVSPSPDAADRYRHAAHHCTPLLYRTGPIGGSKYFTAIPVIALVPTERYISRIFFSA